MQGSQAWACGYRTIFCGGCCTVVCRLRLAYKTRGTDLSRQGDNPRVGHQQVWGSPTTVGNTLAPCKRLLDPMSSERHATISSGEARHCDGKPPPPKPP